jgi:hypothetical protein
MDGDGDCIKMWMYLTLLTTRLKMVSQFYVIYIFSTILFQLANFLLISSLAKLFLLMYNSSLTSWNRYLLRILPNAQRNQTYKEQIKKQHRAGKREKQLQLRDPLHTGLVPMAPGLSISWRSALTPSFLPPCILKALASLSAGATSQQVLAAFQKPKSLHQHQNS